MSDPVAAAEHVPPHRQGEGGARHAQLRLRRRRRHGHLRRQQLAPPAVGVQRGDATSAPIAGTGLADWPITYDELEPYYTQAEWEMGISGQRVDSPFVAPMSKDYPGAAGAAEGLGRAVQGRRDEARAGTSCTGRSRSSPSPTWAAPRCVNCGMCSGFGCHVEGALELGGDDAAARRRDRQLRDPRAFATCARSRSTRSGR